MVQVINLGPSKSALQADVLQGTLGKALEEGLGKFTTNMFINKKMTEMENDKGLMAKPLSDRLLAAQKALAPWGEEGKQYYQQRMQIEQQKTIENAFNTLKNGGEDQDYLGTLAEIGPALISSGQGAALGEIAPLFFQKAQQQASAKAAKKHRENQEKGGQEQPPETPINANVPATPPLNAEQKYRNPQAPNATESTFPGNPLQEEYTPEMTENEQYKYALQLMNDSADLGKPISYESARDSARKENEQIRQHNQAVTAQKQAREQAQDALQTRIISRADNAGYNKHPEMESITKKLALQAKGAPDENAAWDYVRPKLIEVDNALSSLRRSESPLTRGGGVGKMLANISGSYKDFEKAVDDLQPDIEVFKKYGLYPELRNVLTGDLGLGPEQTENAIFPFSDSQKKQLDSFKPRFGKPSSGYLATFPGAEHELSQNEFSGFKEKIGEFLNANPGVNLIALRGNLNQNKRYAWQDISRAISQLIAEGNFKPDLIQKEQYKVVKENPVPSIAKQFEYLWSGAK